MQSCVLGKSTSYGMYPIGLVMAGRDARISEKVTRAAAIAISRTDLPCSNSSNVA